MVTITEELFEDWSVSRVVVHDWHDGIVEGLVFHVGLGWILCTSTAVRVGPAPFAGRLYTLRLPPANDQAEWGRLLPPLGSAQPEFIDSTTVDDAFAALMARASGMKASPWLLESNDLRSVIGYWRSERVR